MDTMLQRILTLVPPYHGGDKEFALSIGYKSGNVIADWKAGRSQSYKGKLQEIANAYNVSVDWLCGNEKNAKKENPDLQGEDGVTQTKLQILNSLDGLSEIQLKEVLGIINAAKRMGNGGQNAN